MNIASTSFQDKGHQHILPHVEQLVISMTGCKQELSASKLASAGIVKHATVKVLSKMNIGTSVNSLGQTFNCKPKHLMTLMASKTSLNGLLVVIHYGMNQA